MTGVQTCALPIYHGTVIHACKAVDNMMEQDATTRGSVEFLKSQLSR